MFLCQGLLIDLGILHGHLLTGVVVAHLGNGIVRQRLIVGLMQNPVDATGQVGCRLILGYVAILLMVYLLGDAAYTETDAGLA